ncbi:hypothetical protein TSUD_355520 [Trifolium subterraneum]|uniref:Uncharacterized protein n=1 Tax=Trifolium subterraneum TaxID=3900 RepID=A0A2Z6LXV3_TRISU|nr:hypothetical protein TSUD_355520 [Trifolium subterraneum]
MHWFRAVDIARGGYHLNWITGLRDKSRYEREDEDAKRAPKEKHREGDKDTYTSTRDNYQGFKQSTEI